MSTYTEISEMTNCEIEELDEVFQDSKHKKHSVKNCLSRPFTITFRLWQILASLFIMVIIITVIGIVAGRFGPGSSNETRRVLPTSKPNRDINECNSGKHNCDVSSSVCHNTIGSFGCACKEGYFENGKDKCADINECEAGKHSCHAKANCNNTKGSFECTCKPGYSGNGVNCTDVNECITGEHNCDANADCNNTEGSFECTCKPGYSGNGVNCTDVNECAPGKRNCNGSFMCHNTKGSFLCICRQRGYFWNGVNCTAFRLDSNILKTNSSYLYHLGKFLQPAIGYYSRWLLCWRATLHGWNVSTQFHRRCDGKRDTVTIIKKGKYVFGGYADIPWESSGGDGFTRKAFIFSISNKEELDPFVIEVRRPDGAIYRWSGFGPVFGFEINIANNANSNSKSFASLGWAYPAPAAVQDPFTILAGTMYFSPDEVEVFYLDPTQ